MARDQTSQSYRKSTLNIHWKEWCWSWRSNTLTTWCEELTCWKDPDAGKDWMQEEKGTTEDEMVGWHHWLNGQVWANSRRWWRTGKSCVLQPMWSQRVRHYRVTEQQQNNICIISHYIIHIYIYIHTWIYRLVKKIMRMSQVFTCL